MGFDPPKTIFVRIKQTKQHKHTTTTTTTCPTKTHPQPVKSHQQQCRPQQQRSQCYHPPHDYMKVPTSMTSPLRPMYPWEQSEAELQREMATKHNKYNNNNNYPTNNTSNNKHRRGFLWHRSSVLAAAMVLLVMVALTAGTLHEDSNATTSSPTTSHCNTNNGKQRGKPLPAMTAKDHADDDHNNNVLARETYQAYKELQDDYRAKAFASHHQDDWKVVKEKDGATVSVLEHPSDPTCPYVRLETVIPTSVAHCWNFLSLHNWHWSMPKMDPFYHTHTVYANLTWSRVNMILVRKQTHRILTFGKRDFVFLSVSDVPLQDGTWVSGSVSVETPDIPRQPGYTRAFQDSIAFYKPIMTTTERGQEEEYCHLTIVCRIDLNDSAAEGRGGFVPMWLYVKTIGATGIKSVLKMRDALLELKQQQVVVVAPSISTANATESSNSHDVKHDTGTPTATSVVSSATPPTPGPSTVANTDWLDQKEPQTWWNLPRGGAFWIPPAAPSPESTFLGQRQRSTTTTVATTTIASSSSSSSSERRTLQERWKPLYQVFTHFRPKQGPHQEPPREVTRRPWGLPWIRHIPLLSLHGNKIKSGA